MSKKQNKLAQMLFSERKRQSRMLAVSIAGILLSISLCAGSTYAWFHDTLSNQNTITIGTFGTNTTVSLSQARSATRLSSTATVLPAGVYNLTIRGVGNTPGYALIYLSATQSNFRRDVYSTPQMKAGTVFTYTFMIHEETAVRVDSIWGISKEENPLKDGAMVYYGRPPVIEETEAEEGEPPADSADAAPDTGSADSTPTTGGAESTPSTGSADSASKAESTPQTPSTGSADSASKHENTPQKPSTGGADSASKPEKTPQAPSTGSADSASKAENTPQTPSTGSTDSTSKAESTPQTQSTGGTGRTSGGTDSTPCAGADPE